jgi:hypothetical protein
MAGVVADDKREGKQEGEGAAAVEKAEKVEKKAEEKAKVEEKAGAGNVGVSKQGSKGARKLQIEEDDDESDEEADDGKGKGKGKEEAFDESDFVERMKGLVTDPLMVAAMKDPKMVAIFEEMQVRRSLNYFSNSPGGAHFHESILEWQRHLLRKLVSS